MKMDVVTGLVGPVGLALAGVAVAQDALSNARETRVDAASVAEARAAALGAPGSARRAQVMAELADAIASGSVDPRTVVFALTEDLLGGAGRAADVFRTKPGDLGDNAAIYDDFSGYPLTDFTNPPSSLVGINGQLNPAGEIIATATNARLGVATDAIMLNVNKGNAGGVPPLMQPAGGEPYLAIARRTGLSELRHENSLAMNYRHEQYVPHPDPVEGHVRVATDWYLTDPGTSHWWSPTSFAEGFIVDRVFFGGTQLGDQLEFGQNEDGVLDRFMSLGPLPPSGGQFYAPPIHEAFPFPVEKWFTIMTVLVQSPQGGIGQGTFVKTPDTIANGFLDPRLAAGDIIPVDKEALGWVNTYPGYEDDPKTPEIEGIGIARSQFNELAPTSGAFQLAPLFAALSIDGVQFGYGNDPTPEEVIGFVPHDAFVDNYIVNGLRNPTPCADLAGDPTVVNGADLAHLLGNWHAAPNPPVFGNPADLNGDGFVNGADLAALLANWGPCPD